MPKRSPAKRDFREYGDNGGRKIKKSKEGASSSSSNVDEELVRSFCLFCVITTLSRIRGKFIWFLVQHNRTSSDFLECKKRLIHKEAKLTYLLYYWVHHQWKGSMFFLPWSRASYHDICRFPLTEIKKQPFTVDHNK